MWTANGILIQGLDDKTDFVKNFRYCGINAYYQFPLTWRYDDESKMLTSMQQSRKTEDGFWVSTEFISDYDLYKQYMHKCHRLNLPIRALFIESNYSAERWCGPLPPMKFLGYEYCPIPIDEQVITDCDWYRPLSKYWGKLNSSGLFSSLDDVENFVEAYTNAVALGDIGDGGMNAYICKVYQIKGTQGDGTIF